MRNSGVAGCPADNFSFSYDGSSSSYSGQRRIRYLGPNGEEQNRRDFSDIERPGPLRL